MAENREFAHLPLPILYQGKPKLHGGGGSFIKTKDNIANFRNHGGYIKRRSAELSHFWRERQTYRTQNQLPHIETGIPILLEIDPQADIDFLRGLGFEIVCEIEEGFIIVATDDVDLNVLNEKADAFIEHIKAKCNSPAKIYALCDDNDRIKRILSPELYGKWATIEADTQYLVDIGVSCCGDIELPDRPSRNDGEDITHYLDREKRWTDKFNAAYTAWDDIKMQREETIETFVSNYGGEILQLVDGTSSITDLPDSFSARLRITGKCLFDLVLNFAYIFEVSESEIINMGMAVMNTNNTPENVNIEEPDADAPTVCIIDSGIQEGHKYLAPAIRSADSISIIPGEPDTSDHVSGGGHGTRVAGAVLFPQEIPTVGEYRLPCWVRNMRVLNADNCMPREIYPPKEIAYAVQKFYSENLLPSRIFNHSIGSRKSCELEHMSSWAAEIDSQSYKNDVLFIQAAGNISRNVISIYIQEGHLYPSYLDRELCRISDPAQSLQALTIGSISLSDYETDDLIGLGKRNEISAFSRSGPGIWDVLKPEVVEYGGTEVLNKESDPPLLSTPPEVCPELIRKSPEGPAYARDEVGTSFSSPKVAYIAAQIEKVLPTAPALLYRALIAQSAHWPIPADQLNKDECVSTLRHIGYGIPNVERATHNDDYRITFVTPTVLELGDDEAHVFRIPIPEEISRVGEDYDILIEITLSYAASPRRTRRRVKSYLSTWLDWCCSRIGENTDTFARRIFETGKVTGNDGDFSWVLGEATNRGLADEYSRKNGTLQKDWCVIKSNQLSDGFCIAVRGHKGWGGLFKAKYTLAVSFEAVNQDVAIYEPIRSMIEIESTVDESEIEVEMHEKRKE